MLDGFVLSHREVVLNDLRAPIPDSAFEVVRKICNDLSLREVPLDAFVSFGDAHVQCMAVELHMEQYLHSRGLSTRPRSERLFFEIVVLHRLKGFFEGRQETNSRLGRAVALMGTMIQHRLTELLLNVEPRLRARLFGIGKFRLISRQAWETEFIGASAVVRVIQAFFEIDEVVIRLPSIRDDLDFGIDLFLEAPPLSSSGLTKGVSLAVSVKSVFRDARMVAEHVGSITQNENGAAAQQQKIIEGAAQASRCYGRDFQPVRIRVGRALGTNYDLALHDAEIVALEQLLGRVERSLQGMHRSRSAAA